MPGTGGSCCGEADCRINPVRIVGDHYEVQFRGDWLAVPAEAILPDGDNPTGEYVSCVGAFYDKGIFLPRVVCFKRRTDT